MTTVYSNAKVFTADPANEWAEAFVVDGRTLSYVGETAGADAAAADGASVVDLGGRVVLPGRGWLFDSLPGAPTAEMIDAVVADVPVYLDANDYHSCWVNSAALAELGITRNTPDPIGGRIGRDGAGEPNGILYETAAQQYAWTRLDELTTDV